MRPKTILAIAVLTISVCANAVGQNSSAPIDRPLWCISAYLGPSTFTTNPWPSLGALGTVLPDCVTTWDVVTWPTWEFNITASPGPGTVTLTAGNSGVTCNSCPSPLANITTADGTTSLGSAGLGNAYLAVWDTTSNQQQPYFLPISNISGSTINLVAAPPIPATGTLTLQYHIYYFSRVTTLFDNAAKNNAKVILVWEPTPAQYVTTTNGAASSTACHNTGMNGAGSCYPPSDLLSPNNTTNCSTFSNGGAGTLVGTGDCQTKLAVADLMNFLKQTGRIGTLLGISTGNESDKCPNDNKLGTCDANFAKFPASNDGEWGDTIADHATRAIDICAQAKAVYAPISCGGPGIESLVSANGFGANALCGIAFPNNIKGADWANAWWGTSNILSKMDFFGYHGYIGYVPQAQDYALNSVIATCPNIRAAVQTLPIWDTEHDGGYAGLSSGTMVQVSTLSSSGTPPTCTANLSQQVAGFPFPLFQNLNWKLGELIVVAGTTSGAADTPMTGVPSTSLTNTQVQWTTGCPTGASQTTKTFVYDLTLTYGFAAEAYLLQYFRNVTHRPGAVNVINWEEWINDSINAQGFPLCFGFGGGYTSTGCTNLTLNGQALGEALKWMRLGGGVKPTSAFQCQFLSLGTAPSTKCPFQGIMFATGVEANGTQVEVVFYSDPVNHSTSANPFTAPSWAQHYLAVDGTCTSVTGGATQVTLTHAKPIMFTSD